MAGRPDQSRAHINYDFPTGKDWAQGYYLLAFNPHNYIAACKSCNTPLKSNHFPIAGKRGPQSDDSARLASEQPYLLYPLGRRDDNPEDIFTFDGFVPKPVKQSGHRRRRAVVTIDFFALDIREELLRGRAETVCGLKSALIILESNVSAAKKAFAERTIAHLQSENSPHTNCARSFLRLHQRDPARAELISNAALDYLVSHDPPIAAGP